MKKSSLLPIVRSLSVSWPPDEAFRRFTADFAQWWPVRTHSIGGACVERIVFECKAGGLIFEQHEDGRRFQWGQLREWDPPRLLAFSWHPSRAPSTAQEVEVRFHPETNGTRLELSASGWENWGRGAPRARRGYDLGWGYVLNVWAGRRTPGMRLIDALVALIGLGQRLRGGRQAAIARAGGELESTSAAR
jgi:uncharacterized protein YndB with AHSA1/START domain